MKRPGFTLKASADPSIAVLRLYGPIGASMWADGAVTARDVATAMDGLSPTVTAIRVFVNSEGGDAGEGLGIANLLREQHQSKGRRVEVIIDGLAASAASVVAMGGESITIADNGLMMIHRPWGLTVGNADDHLRAIEALDAFGSAIIASYRWHSPLSEDELGALMAAETWFTASEAVAAGLATSIGGAEETEDDEDAPVAARGSMVFAQLQQRAPVAVRARLARIDAARAVDPLAVMAAVQAAGCGLELAQELIRDHVSPRQMQARIAEVQTALAAAERRANDIRAMCSRAGVPRLADGYVASALSIEAIGSHLVKVTSHRDDVEIDASLTTGGERARSGVNTESVYRHYNARHAAEARG